MPQLPALPLAEREDYYDIGLCAEDTACDATLTAAAAAGLIPVYENPSGPFLEMRFCTALELEDSEDGQELLGFDRQSSCRDDDDADDRKTSGENATRSPEESEGAADEGKVITTTTTTNLPLHPCSPQSRGKREQQQQRTQQRYTQDIQRLLSTRLYGRLEMVPPLSSIHVASASATATAAATAGDTNEEGGGCVSANLSRVTNRAEMTDDEEGSDSRLSIISSLSSTDDEAADTYGGGWAAAAPRGARGPADAHTYGEAQGTTEGQQQRQRRDKKEEEKGSGSSRLKSSHGHTTAASTKKQGREEEEEMGEEYRVVSRIDYVLRLWSTPHSARGVVIPSSQEPKKAEEEELLPPPPEVDSAHHHHEVAHSKQGSAMPPHPQPLPLLLTESDSGKDEAAADKHIARSDGNCVTGTTTVTNSGRQNPTHANSEKTVAAAAAAAATAFKKSETALLHLSPRGVPLIYGDGSRTQKQQQDEAVSQESECLAPTDRFFLDSLLQKDGHLPTFAEMAAFSAGLPTCDRKRGEECESTCRNESGRMNEAKRTAVHRLGGEKLSATTISNNNSNNNNRDDDDNDGDGGGNNNINNNNNSNNGSDAYYMRLLHALRARDDRETVAAAEACVEAYVSAIHAAAEAAVSAAAAAANANSISNSTTNTASSSEGVTALPASRAEEGSNEEDIACATTAPVTGGSESESHQQQQEDKAPERENKRARTEGGKLEGTQDTDNSAQQQQQQRGQEDEAEEGKEGNENEEKGTETGERKTKPAAPPPPLSLAEALDAVEECVYVKKSNAGEAANVTDGGDTDECEEYIVFSVNPVRSS